MHFAPIPNVPSCVLANQDILGMVLAVQVTIIAQNEWTSLAIHDRRSGKFQRTSAFNDRIYTRDELSV